MTHKIFIVLTLVFATSDIFGQTNQLTEEERQTYIKAGWLYSETDSVFVEYQVFNKLFSSDKKYEIIVRSVGLGDHVEKSQYWLVRTGKKDTTELMTVLRHDFPPPNFFWTSSGYLVYEQGDYSKGREIEMWNLLTNKIEFSTPGFLPVREEISGNFFDNENEVLIFFKSGTKETSFKVDLMSLDIRTKTVKKLMTFKTTFDYEYPLVSLDTKTRKLKVKSQDVISAETAEDNLDY